MSIGLSASSTDSPIHTETVQLAKGPIIAAILIANLITMAAGALLYAIIAFLKS
jgi:hypothetical protein